MHKLKLFARYKAIRILMWRAHRENNFDKFEHLEHRAELIEYEFQQQMLTSKINIG